MNFILSKINKLLQYSYNNDVFYLKIGFLILKISKLFKSLFNFIVKNFSLYNSLKFILCNYFFRKIQPINLQLSFVDKACTKQNCF